MQYVGVVNQGRGGGNPRVIGGIGKYMYGVGVILLGSSSPHRVVLNWGRVTKGGGVGK